MKLYHGTSFENACKILSEELWHPVLFASQDEYVQYVKWQLGDKPLSLFVNMTRTHFTTNINDAKGYALLHKRPVILWWDCPDINTGGRYAFGVDEPIKTNKVKALIGVTAEIRLWGNLVNAIYHKGIYVSVFNENGLNYASSDAKLIISLEHTLREHKEFIRNKQEYKP